MLFIKDLLSSVGNVVVLLGRTGSEILRHVKLVVWLLEWFWYMPGVETMAFVFGLWWLLSHLTLPLVQYVILQLLKGLAWLARSAFEVFCWWMVVPLVRTLLDATLGRLYRPAEEHDNRRVPNHPEGEQAGHAHPEGEQAGHVLFEAANTESSSDEALAQEPAQEEDDDPDILFYEGLSSEEEASEDDDLDEDDDEGLSSKEEETSEEETSEEEEPQDKEVA